MTRLFIANFFLLLCHHAVHAADQTVLQTSSLSPISRMTAYGNTLVVGYPSLSTGVSGGEATGGVHITYFDDTSADYNLLSSGALSETKLANPYKLGEFGNTRTNANGNAGFGESLAMSSDTELFIAAASLSTNTGRVYCYRGRNSQWSAMQTLNPQSHHKQETYIDIDSFFGGSIAAISKTLIVGCQNCNTTALTPSQSGEVYVYSPNPSRSYWSASQILVSGDEQVKFLGEYIAIHDDIIVATGDGKVSAAQHITDKPTRAVIFQRPKGKRDGYFTQQQVLTVPNSASYTISEVAVYDETIVMSSSLYTNNGNPNEIYIYYPSSSRYGYRVSRDPKAKPKAIHWSLHQTLLNLAGTFVLNFYLQIQGNNLVYSSFTATKDQVILYKRPSLAEQFIHTGVSEVDVFEIDVGTSDLFAFLTANQRLFFANLGSAGALFKPIDLNPSEFHCLQIYVGDQFGDGWGDSTVLSIETPFGHKDSYAPRCDSYNPITYRYCPFSNDDKGIYKLRIEHAKGEERGFLWEIMWKVYDERSGKWYFGSHQSEMDFEWSSQFSDFTARRLDNLVDSVEVCSVCASGPPEESVWNDIRKPKPKPRRSLENLRSLRGKSTTTSPTVSPAPTIEVTGHVSSSSLYFKMSNSGNDVTPWFDSENSGTMYYISDVNGRKLFATGTGCVSGASEISCWIDLSDGDYVLRVGGALDSSVDRQWQFCGGIHYQSKQTELFFTVQNGICVPSLARSNANVCNNILKVTTLAVEIIVTGEFSSISTPLTEKLQVEATSFIDSLLYRRIGQVSLTSKISSMIVQESTVVVWVLVGLPPLTTDETASLIHVLGDTEPLHSHSQTDGMSSNSVDLRGMHDGLQKMSLGVMKFFDEIDDLTLIDESSFHSVTNFVASKDDFINSSPASRHSWASSTVMMNVLQNWNVTTAAIGVALLLSLVVWGIRLHRGRGHVWTETKDSTSRNAFNELNVDIEVLDSAFEVISAVKPQVTTSDCEEKGTSHKNIKRQKVKKKLVLDEN